MNKNITIGVPHSGKIYSQFVVCFMKLAIDLVERGFIIDTQFKEGSLIPKQRNDIAKGAYESGNDLLFVDSDMVFSADDFNLLYDEDKEIIGGLCYSRRRPYHGVVYYDPGPEYESFARIKKQDIPFTPFECYGVGTGFILIKNEVLQKMYKKDFVEKYGRPFNMWNMKNGDQFGEDLSFCLRARKAGFNIWCHPQVNVGHIGNIIISKENNNLLNS